MPVDNSPEKLKLERERMQRLVTRLKEAARVSANHHLAADFNAGWVELERLLLLIDTHWSEIDRAIVRAKVLLDRAHGP